MSEKMGSQGTPEEIKKATEMMSENQRRESWNRQQDFEYPAVSMMTKEQERESNKRKNNLESGRTEEWEGKRAELNQELQVERKKFVDILIKNIEHDQNDDELARLIEPHLSLLTEDELIRVAKSGSTACQVVADYMEPEIAKLNVNERIEFAEKYGGYWRMWAKVASVKGNLSRMEMARIGDIADGKR